MIRLVRASGDEARRLQEAVEAERVKTVQAALGFSRVMQLMRESKKPAVGHNLIFDICYSLDSFVGPLPHRWLDFKVSTVLMEGGSGVDRQGDEVNLWLNC